jgi:precorrin-6B methylase 2
MESNRKIKTKIRKVYKELDKVHNLFIDGIVRYKKIIETIEEINRLYDMGLL